MPYLKITNRRITPSESNPHLVYKEYFPRPELRYSDDQPRDDHGRFTSGGGSGLTSGGDSGTIGLGAGSSNGLVEPHEKPEHIKKININNNAEIKAELESFERIASKKNYEMACVITQSGDVYHCFGVKDAVYPDADLGDEIYGAIISHNHIASETNYSFGNDDLASFETYDLNMLVGFDHKYRYVLDRNPSKRDAMPDDWTTEEMFQHVAVIYFAEERGYGYRRIKI